MLKTILSISGKPGLYKLISQGKNMLIVESLVDKKRFPAYGNEKIISLGDIAMYTDDRDRVYVSDIKKLISWYNLLVASGMTDFEEASEAAAEETKEATAE